MSDWIEQYSAALDARDAREQAHKPYIEAYTKLADRTASAAAAATPTPLTRAPPPPSDLTNLRTALTSTQKARTTLQTQLTTQTSQLQTLHSTQTQSRALIATLEAQKTLTERKVRDLSEEIRGKTRLVERAQDEMVALQLQLSMAEQRSERLARENEELVERWMKRVGEEVERVNRGSGWE